MFDRYVLIIVDNKLTEIFYLELEFIYTFKHYVPVKFIASAEYHVEDVIFDIGLNLC